MALCQELGWIINIGKSELEPKQILNFRRLPVQPQGGQGQAHSGMLANRKLKSKMSFLPVLTVWSDNLCP